MCPKPPVRDRTAHVCSLPEGEWSSPLRPALVLHAKCFLSLGAQWPQSTSRPICHGMALSGPDGLSLRAVLYSRQSILISSFSPKSPAVTPQDITGPCSFLTASFTQLKEDMHLEAQPAHRPVPRTVLKGSHWANHARGFQTGSAPGPLTQPLPSPQPPGTASQAAVPAGLGGPGPAPHWGVWAFLGWGQTPSSSPAGSPLPHPGRAGCGPHTGSHCQQPRFMAFQSLRSNLPMLPGPHSVCSGATLQFRSRGALASALFGWVN